LMADVYRRFSRRSRSARRMRFFWEWMLAISRGAANREGAGAHAAARCRGGRVL
jgi:hypothetical protein